MQIAARQASEADLAELVRMYRQLEEEQAALKSLWPLADGLAEPVEDSFRLILGDTDSTVVVGTIDDLSFGFMWMRAEGLLPQAAGC